MVNEKVIIIYISNGYHFNMSKKILVLGASGQLGKEATRLFSSDPSKYECIAPDEKDADITVFSKLSKIVLDSRPNFVVNCAAFTNVDKAETNAGTVTLINAYGAENAARASLLVGAAFIHISTDYVYDGKWKELKDRSPFGYSHRNSLDSEKPLNVYGMSKLNGEELIQDKMSEIAPYSYFILRTSGVYGIYGNHFLKKLEIALESNKDKCIQLIADQRYCPTSARQLARQIKMMVDLSEEDREYVVNRAGNVLNAANLTYESPYLFFEKYLLMQKKYDLVSRISPISFDDYFAEHPNAAKRPKDCPLDIELKRVLDLCEITSTEPALEEYIETKKELSK